jgi:hypothetical protein
VYGRICKTWFALAAVISLAAPLLGQVQIGDNLTMNLNGTVQVGYNDTYGSAISSSHGVGFGGTAGLSGSYYNPNFLSFNVNPYFNQSRSNSNFGSVSDASGVTLSSAIFAGSRFPGSVSYTAAYNTTGNYGIPGITAFDTNGNNQSLAVGWSALVPNWPTLNVGYQQGSQNYSLYGSNQTGNSDFRSIYANSNYTFKGFNLGGGVSTGNSNALIPGVLVNSQETNSTSDNTNYTFSLGHSLPWSGSFSGSFNRSDINSDYLGYKFNGAIDRLAVSAGMSPTQKLHLSFGADYTDNLSGSLYQALVPGQSTSTSQTLASSTTSSEATSATGPTTGGLTGTQLNTSSHAWNFLANASYSFAPNLQAQGEVEQREQTYAGANYASTLYGGGVFYTRQILGGYLGAGVNLFDSINDSQGTNSLGYTANVNYNRRIGGWQIGGFFNYAQNVQTILVTYNSSFYSFSGSVARQLWGTWVWTANANGSHSGLSAVPGSASSGQGYSSSIGNGRLNLSANYSKSNGNSLASGGGLVPTPIPPIIPPSLLVLYGGESYAFALSGSPIRHMSATVSYIKANNNLSNQGVSSANQFVEENAYLQYQFRQVGLQGGYTYLKQGFSASGTPPASVTSFYVGVYRWFNFF